MSGNTAVSKVCARLTNRALPACLRACHTVPIDAPLLSRIERAEQVLREQGFLVFRVRHHGDVARLELAADEIPRAILLRESLASAIRATGYVHVTLDLLGYRSGSLNEVLS